MGLLASVTRLLDIFILAVSPGRRGHAESM